jgi:hypothetical protein
MRMDFDAAIMALGYCATPPVTLQPLYEAPQVRPATELVGAWLALIRGDSTVALNQRDTVWVEAKTGDTGVLEVYGLERTDTDSIAWRFEAVVCEIGGERYLDIGASDKVVQSGLGTVLPVHLAFRLRQVGETIALGFLADTLWEAFLSANGLPVISQGSTLLLPFGSNILQMLTQRVAEKHPHAWTEWRFVRVRTGPRIGRR